MSSILAYLGVGNIEVNSVKQETKRETKDNWVKLPDKPSKPKQNKSKSLVSKDNNVKNKIKSEVKSEYHQPDEIREMSISFGTHGVKSESKIPEIIFIKKDLDVTPIAPTGFQPSKVGTPILSDSKPPVKGIIDPCVIKQRTEVTNPTKMNKFRQPKVVKRQELYEVLETKESKRN